MKGKVPVFVYTGNGEEKKIDAEVPSTPHKKGQRGYWQCLKRADCTHLRVKAHITEKNGDRIFSHFAHNGKYHSPPFTILPF